jgi:TonB-dependent SusC/RagA subfamily outer membrane receptor
MRANSSPIAPLLLAAMLLSACSAGRAGSTQAPVQTPRTTESNVITAEQIRDYPTSVSVEELVARHVPGVQIVRRNDGSIGLRIQSLASGSTAGEPLFVVDGVPVRRAGGTLGINPRDIQRIEVLKDGGSTAMYGFRGAYGVILITTK